MASSRKTLVLRFNRNIAKRIIRAAQHLYSDGLAHGIRNIFQPGLIKEIIIADILGHRVISNKRLPDACSATDESVFYEYLTCEERGSWQIDRMFSKPWRSAGHRSTESFVTRSSISCHSNATRWMFLSSSRSIHKSPLRKPSDNSMQAVMRYRTSLSLKAGQR